MPAFNSGRWIGEAIESILGQTFRDFVLVISDNASTDDTPMICARYANKDARVRYFRNETNLGAFKNYDRVFELSSSKYFKWAASSDVCKDRFLELCVALLETRPDVVLSYPRTALFSHSVELAEPYEDNLDLQDERPFDRITKLLTRLRLNNVMNGVIRSDALRQTALHAPYAASDYNMIADLALRGKFVEIPERLFYRRMTKETATVLKDDVELAKFFENDPDDVFEHQGWRVELGYLRSLWRAPIQLGQKLRIGSFFVRLWIYAVQVMLAGRGSSRVRHSPREGGAFQKYR
jgi:glycosyltransferase involved in cell wall biosynthesis